MEAEAINPHIELMNLPRGLLLGPAPSGQHTVPPSRER